MKDIWITDAEEGQPLIYVNKDLKIKQKLIIARKSRVHPVIDKKIILSWNSILLKGLICCYQSLGKKKYLELALKNADLITSTLPNYKQYLDENDYFTSRIIVQELSLIHI